MIWIWFLTYKYFYNHVPITLHARFVLLSTDPFVWKLCAAVLSRLFFGAVSCESCNYLQALSDRQTTFQTLYLSTFILFIIELEREVSLAWKSPLFIPNVAKWIKEVTFEKYIFLRSDEGSNQLLLLFPVTGFSLEGFRSFTPLSGSFYLIW